MSRVAAPLNIHIEIALIKSLDLRCNPFQVDYHHKIHPQKKRSDHHTQKITTKNPQKALYLTKSC